MRGQILGRMLAELEVMPGVMDRIGEAKSMVQEALKGVVPVVGADSLRDAVRQAWDFAVPDGLVLLAPACSSFDMFADYADRGRQFKEAVRKLVTET